MHFGSVDRKRDQLLPRAGAAETDNQEPDRFLPGKVLSNDRCIQRRVHRFRKPPRFLLDQQLLPLRGGDHLDT